MLLQLFNSFAVLMCGMPGGLSSLMFESHNSHTLGKEPETTEGCKQIK
jgi:hypothetical protein